MGTVGTAEMHFIYDLTLYFYNALNFKKFQELSRNDVSTVSTDIGA